MAHNHFSIVRVRPGYSGPTSYHPRRVDVRIRRVTARKAREYIPSLAVGLLDVAADAALPRSVPRIDIADGNAYTPGFVVDLPLKVGESPRVQDTSLRSASPYPVANAFEVLDGNSASGAFSRSNNPLCNTVIHVTREATLLDAPLTKKPLRTLGSLPLKFGTKSVGSRSKRVQVRTREVFSVACRGDVDDAYVHTKPTRDLPFLYVRNIDRDEKVEASVSNNEVRFASVMDEKLALMIPTHEGDSLPPCQRPDVGSLFSEGEDTGIIGDRPKRPEPSSGFPVELVGICDFGDAANENLRREVRERCSGAVVSELVEVELFEGFRSPSYAREEVASFIGSTNRRGQQPRLFGRGLKLNLHRELHKPSSSTFNV
jgi:hypothetical protein